MLHQSNDKTLESNANKDANSSRILIDNSASKEKSFVSKTKLNSILDSILKPSNSLPLDQELTKEIDKNAISVEHEMATISINLWDKSWTTLEIPPTILGGYSHDSIKIFIH